jgi:hypothetical protein
MAHHEKSLIRESNLGLNMCNGDHAAAVLSHYSEGKANLEPAVCPSSIISGQHALEASMSRLGCLYIL